MSSCSEPSIITLEKPERIDAPHTAGLAPWSWCITMGSFGYVSSAASMRWRRNASPAYLRAPAEAWRITGLRRGARRLEDRLHLLEVVHVEGGHAVAVLGGMVEHLAKGNEGHGVLR